MLQADKFSSPIMNLTVNQKPQCVVEYVIDLFAPPCKQAHAKAARELSKELTVPGFRKGKAPIATITKRFGHQLEQKWQKELANLAYAEAAALTKIPLLQNDSKVVFKMDKFSLDGAHLSLEFETVPKIPLIDPAQCVLHEVKNPEISQEQVAEALRQTQFFFASWHPVVDRPIQDGDYLLLDIDVIEDNQEPEELFREIRFEVGPKKMADWMRQAILGKRKGDRIESISQPDEDLSEKEKKEYLPKKAAITILEVETPSLPPLDDLFAQKLGANNLEHAEQKISALLEKKREEARRAALREQIVTFLLSHSFELPASIIEKEVRYRFEQLARIPQFKEAWTRGTEKDRQELLLSIKTEAEKAVRLFYLCHQIFMDKKISILPSDIAGLTQPKDPIEMLLYPTPQEPEQQELDAKMKQAETYSKLLFDKSELWIIAHAKQAEQEEDLSLSLDTTAEETKQSAPNTKEPPVESTKKRAPRKKSSTKKSAS